MTTSNKSHLAAVKQAPKTNGNLGAPRKSASFAAAVADLQPGDTAARSHALNGSMTLDEFAADLTAMKIMLRNNAAPAVKAARERTGGLYSVEVGESILPSGKITLVVLVTRTD